MEKAITGTNKFTVTDENKLKDLISRTAPKGIKILAEEKGAGVKIYSLFCNGMIFGFPNSNPSKPRYDYDGFVRELQSILPKGEAAVFTEALWDDESVTASCNVITWNSFDTIDLGDEADALIKRMR